MTHNPNSQDEMAAEEYALDIRGLIVKCEGVPYDGPRAGFAYLETKDAFLAGCKYKAEKMARAQELIKHLEMHLKHIGMATKPGDNGERTYLMNDDAYICKQIEKALEEIEKYRKGEG